MWWIIGILLFLLTLVAACLIVKSGKDADIRRAELLSQMHK